MKKFICLFVLTIFVFSCSNDDCDIQNIDDNLCGGQNLGIDELGRFSFLFYTPVNGVYVIEQSYSKRWNWKIYNDTIEVAGDISNFSTRHIFFKKNGNCIDYLSSRDVYFDDNIVFDENGNIISGGYSWSNYNDLQFKLQKYNLNKILIGEVSNTKFWMEFTPDVHRTIPYEYEQYYHN